MMLSHPGVSLSADSLIIWACSFRAVQFASPAAVHLQTGVAKLFGLSCDVLLGLLFGGEII